jgi:5-methylcytosine-specific restriction endonuclease McrA
MNHGTYAGYRAHRRRNEEICGPCRLAMNKHRREYHKKNPHKNIEYGTKYRNKPEKLEVRAAARAERAAKKEAKERDILLKRIHRLMVRQIKATARAEAVKKILEESRRIELEKEMAAQARRDAYQARLDEWARRRQIKADISAQRKIAREAIRAARRAEKIASRQARESRLAELVNQHGTTPGDYDRCRKLNGKACDPCKAGMAAYVRNKVKTDPRYKEHRRGQNRRRDKRVRINGFEYYNTQDVLDRWGYDCHICKAPINFSAPRQCGEPGWEEGLHLDHVIPLAKGGPDTVENVKPAHAKCNTDKRDLVYGVEEVSVTSA